MYHGEGYLSVCSEAPPCVRCTLRRHTRTWSSSSLQEEVGEQRGSSSSLARAECSLACRPQPQGTQNRHWVYIKQHPQKQHFHMDGKVFDIFGKLLSHIYCKKKNRLMHWQDYLFEITFQLEICCSQSGVGLCQFQAVIGREQPTQSHTTHQVLNAGVPLSRDSR